MKAKSTTTERITALLTPFERAEFETALAEIRKVNPEMTAGHFLTQTALRGLRAEPAPALPGLKKLEAAFQASEEARAKEISILARATKDAIESNHSLRRSNEELLAAVSEIAFTIERTQELAVAAKISADKAKTAAENNAEIANAARMLAEAVKSVGHLLR